MSRKIKNFSGKIILDFLAFFVMSGLYLVGRLLSAFIRHKDGMI